VLGVVGSKVEMEVFGGEHCTLKVLYQPSLGAAILCVCDKQTQFIFSPMFSVLL